MPIHRERVYILRKLFVQHSFLIDIEIHTTTGRYGRKIFSNLIFIVETKEGTRKVNISDATQYEAEFLKENLETPTNISVHVNNKDEIVFVH